jgi:REP element-mobilizing transposase RayT
MPPATALAGVSGLTAEAGSRPKMRSPTTSIDGAADWSRHESATAPTFVQTFTDVPARTTSRNFVNNLQTTASRLLRKEFADKLNRVYRKGVFWSQSHCIISCAAAPLPILKQYVERQAHPHHQLSAKH